jgi:hypothetical protein
MLLVGTVAVVLVGFRAWSLRRRARCPVEVRRYSQREAMVSLRFRYREYAELLLRPEGVRDSANAIRDLEPPLATE